MNQINSYLFPFGQTKMVATKEQIKQWIRLGFPVEELSGIVKSPLLQEVLFELEEESQNKSGTSDNYKIEVFTYD